MARQRRLQGHPFLRRRLRDDPELRREVKAARAVGQPRSRILGREPRVITEHEYDEHDRLIRSVTTSEPLWTDEDRLLLLALEAEEAEQCGECRQPLEVSTDPKTQRTWRVERVTCEACRILEAEVGNDAEGRRRGTKYAVVRAA